MVGRPGKYQPRFTSGELDPLIQANTDEKIYFTGAARFENVRPIPQGGFANRWGTRSRGRIRNQMQMLATDTATPTAPSGGTAANAIDANPATFLTSGALGAGNQVVFKIVWPSLVTLAAIDLASFAIQPNGSPAPTTTQPVTDPVAGTFFVEVSVDNVTFVPLGNPLAITGTLRTRRIASPPAQPAVILACRISVNVTPTGGRFWLNEARFWFESVTASPVRIWPFSRAPTVAYDMLFTDQNADVYDASGLVASIASGLPGDQVSTLKTVQQLDTMLLFHQQLQTQRILRQGNSAEWNIEPAPFTNVPNHNYGGTYGNAVPAQWTLQFFNFDVGTGSIPLPSGGASFTISVNGQTSPAIQQPPTNYSATAAAIQAAILALPGVHPGVTVVQDPVTLTKFLVTFTGAGNEGDGWAVSGIAIDKADAAITAAHKVVGVTGGEPIMSAARGWPGCGLFYGERLLIGGFQGVPNAFLCSFVGDPFNLDTRLTGASAPFLIPLDTRGDETIIELHRGRTLDIFTDGGEYWLSGGALDRTQTPVIVFASDNGISPTARSVESGGSTLFAARLGGTLFDFKFDYSQQNYASSNISVTSASLVKGIVDMDKRRLTGNTDVDELYAIRNDGGAFMVNLLREQEITSFARMTTDGSFLAVDVNGRFEVNVATKRVVAGQLVQFIERFEENLLLDQAEDHVIPSGPGTVVTGLVNHEGVNVWAIADRYVQGPFLVTGGQITLNFPATNVTIGRWSPPVVVTLPQPRDVAPRTVVKRPARVHTVRLQVVNTTSVAIAANDGPAYDVPIRKFGQMTDIAPLDSPFTGELVLEGLQGFSESGSVTITQVKPGLLTVTGVTIEVDL